MVRIRMFDKFHIYVDNFVILYGKCKALAIVYCLNPFNYLKYLSIHHAFWVNLLNTGLISERIFDKLRFKKQTTRYKLKKRICDIIYDKKV